VGNGQWNIPALRDLLDAVLVHHTAFDDFEVTHTFPHIGPKSMRLNARPIVRTAGQSPLILLTIEDVTARQQAEATLRQQRDVLTVTLGSIGDAVLTTDPHGRITFLNPVAEAVTGWPPGRPRPAVRGGVPSRPCADPPAAGEPSGQVLRRPRGRFGAETLLRTRDDK
jgi:PAS domain-containing protein